MYLIGKLANEIEEISHGSKVILTFHDLGVECVSQKYQQFMKVLIAVSSTGVNLGVVVANTVNIAIFFGDLTKWDTRILKGIITGIYV
jgi:hypothetical protein